MDQQFKNIYIEQQQEGEGKMEEQQKIQLLALDVDGTLFGTDGNRSGDSQGAGKRSTGSSGIRERL